MLFETPENPEPMQIDLPAPDLSSPTIGEPDLHAADSAILQPPSIPPELRSLPAEPVIPLRIRIRHPCQVQDDLPEDLPPLQDMDSDGGVGGPSRIRRVFLIVRDGLTTVANSLGLYRKYLHRPTFDPDHFVPPHDLAKSAIEQNEFLPELKDSDSDEEGDYLHENPTISLLAKWQVTGSNEKSNAEMDRLVSQVFADPNFNVEDARRFKAQQVANEIDKQQENQQTQSRNSFLGRFKETTVPIDVPSGSASKPARTFNIPGLHYRPLVDLIQSAFAHPLAAQFHLSPFKLFHQSESRESQRVYSEVFNSDAFIKEDDDVRNRGKNPPDDPDCKREKVVAALSFWSDSTHLTNFGTAKLWPIYMALGNLSKYIRAMPDVGALQHVAYIPSLPDSFQTKLGKWHTRFSKSKSQQKDILTHCRRKLMHAVWRLLLDDEFLHAYTYGIVIKCVDGVERRVYPRIFTYSADYPEK
ncbi:hypothetical protein EST38_g11213 [Candolleomyces aberdarensis]|uniref:Uncharacterized protein n=1 Tax=Candolleomyces aberdarensis TaxID=2316362 RepID=A0A4Q2D8P0_9AGAR|nr:hypothetical protein EST38_g11213 [Candolleomyces aberdarensis]